MSLLYRRPSGLLQLAGYVAISSFFRVCESVANKGGEKKKKKKRRKSAPRFCFPPLHPSPAGELDSTVNMDHVPAVTERPLGLVPWRCQPTVLEALGKGGGVSCDPALGPPAGLRNCAQPLAELGCMGRRAIKRGQGNGERREGDGKERALRDSQPDFS